MLSMEIERLTGLSNARTRDYEIEKERVQKLELELQKTSGHEGKVYSLNQEL